MMEEQIHIAMGCGYRAAISAVFHRSQRSKHCGYRAGGGDEWRVVKSAGGRAFHIEGLLCQRLRGKSVPDVRRIAR